MANEKSNKGVDIGEIEKVGGHFDVGDPTTNVKKDSEYDYFLANDVPHRIKELKHRGYEIDNSQESPIHGQVVMRCKKTITEPRKKELAKRVAVRAGAANVSEMANRVGPDVTSSESRR